MTRAGADRFIRQSSSAGCYLLIFGSQFQKTRAKNPGGSVAGTIAPARELPDKNNNILHLMLSNLNLVVPVAAAVLVIILAIIVICLLRGKSDPHKGTSVFLLHSHDRAAARVALQDVPVRDPRVARPERGRAARRHRGRHLSRYHCDLRGRVAQIAWSRNHKAQR